MDHRALATAADNVLQIAGAARRSLVLGECLALKALQEHLQRGH
jgi:hypothetical protein